MRFTSMNRPSQYLRVDEVGAFGTAAVGRSDGVETNAGALGSD